MDALSAQSPRNFPQGLPSEVRARSGAAVLTTPQERSRRRHSRLLVVSLVFVVRVVVVICVVIVMRNVVSGFAARVARGGVVALLMVAMTENYERAKCSRGLMSPASAAFRALM